MSAEALSANSLGLPSPRRNLLLAQKWNPDSKFHIGSQIIPEYKHDMPFAEWDEEEGVFGLAQASAMGAKPLNVVKEAFKTYREDPFVWKESDWIDESGLLRVRMAGTFNQLAGQQAIVKMQRRLNIRLDSRLEQQRWAAIQGSNVVNENNVKRTITYAVQTPAAPTIPWDTVATAIPVDNIQAWLALFDGVGAGNVRCYYGRAVGNALAQNAMIRDLAKQSGFALDIGISQGQVSSLISKAVGDIESMQMYTQGYKNSSGTFTPFIGAKNFVMVVSPPQGQPLGNFVTTPALQNGGIASPKAGRYAVTHDKINDEARYGMTVGYHGIPVLYFPTCIIVVQVLA